METIEVRPQSLNIVLLYDVLDVNKVPLDPIKASTKFNLISLLPAEVLGGVLALASDPLKAKVTIQSNRLEYIDEQDVPFSERQLDELWKLLRAIPSFSVKSYGVNFFLRVTPRHDKDSGTFVAEHYIKDGPRLVRTLDQPILSASVRLLLGTTDYYRDLRITPTDIASKDLMFQYHLHRDIVIAETEKLVQTIAVSVTESWNECDQWLKKLP